MREKKKERQQAIALRKEGETIPNIAKKVGVSRGSVSLWLRGISLPEKTRVVMRARASRNRLLAHEARRQLTRNKLADAAILANTLMLKNRIDPETALMLCSLMYWCEGTKSKNDSEFTFTNAEPLTIRGFLALLRKALPLDESRFRIKMHLHEYHNEHKQRAFWSNVTGIPETQFQNTFWKPNTGKSIKRDYPGCIHLRYHDVLLSRKIYATARALLGNVIN
jgi:Homeodomain-like domain